MAAIESDDDFAQLYLQPSIQLCSAVHEYTTVLNHYSFELRAHLQQIVHTLLTQIHKVHTCKALSFVHIFFSGYTNVCKCTKSDHVRFVCTLKTNTHNLCTSRWTWWSLCAIWLVKRRKAIFHGYDGLCDQNLPVAFKMPKFTRAESEIFGTYTHASMSLRDRDDLLQ